MDRDTFKENAKKSIDEIFAKIDELEAKKTQAKAEVKEKYEKKIAELKLIKNDLQAKYDDLLNTSEDEWEEVKHSFSTSFDYLKKGIRELVSLFT